MSEKKETLNEGYQPRKNNGYQPKPSGQFGYQPGGEKYAPPSPPKSGSNVINSNIKSEK